MNELVKNFTKFTTELNAGDPDSLNKFYEALKQNPLVGQYLNNEISTRNQLTDTEYTSDEEVVGGAAPQKKQKKKKEVKKKKKTDSDTSSITIVNSQNEDDEKDKKKKNKNKKKGIKVKQTNTTEDIPIMHIAAGDIDPVYKGGVLDVKRIHNTDKIYVGYTMPDKTFMAAKEIGNIYCKP